MEWGHGVAFWNVFWNEIKLDIEGDFVAHHFKDVN